MPRYLLDADAVIDYLADYAPTVELIDNLVAGGDELCVSEVVVAEIYTGLRLEAEQKAAAFLEPLSFLASTRASAERAGRWRFQQARRGEQIAMTDALIAAFAIEYGASLVTGNIRHFPMSELRLLPLPR